MMGGHKMDEIWWWDGKTYVSYAGRAVPPVIERTRKAVADLIARPQDAMPLPGFCKPLDRPITVGSQTLGTGRFQRAAGDLKAFRVSPAADAAVLAMAAGFVQDMKLGQGPQTDILSVGLSATDYIGHALGTQGAEMCIQMAELDRSLAGFFDVLDATGVDYEVMLTADHGAHDMTERQQIRAMPMESHVAPEAKTKAMSAEIAKALGLPNDPPIMMSAEGDIYLNTSLPAATRAKVLAEAKRRYEALPQVAAALTRDEIAATPWPTTPPETWTLKEKARSSYDPTRSGDLLILLKPRVTTIEEPAPAMSRRMARPGTMTGVCRSCSGARGWPGSNNRCRWKPSTSPRRWPRRSDCRSRVWTDAVWTLIQVLRIRASGDPHSSPAREGPPRSGGGGCHRWP